MTGTIFYGNISNDWASLIIILRCDNMKGKSNKCIEHNLSSEKHESCMKWLSFTKLDEV